ncbi:hypothetical protein [Burkholderia vietnamiensis]|uniref:hypothetical protein n=1 Tax=Burkholderia vietnamiensis TaxID=60552 RepID=UPI001CF1E396|nr:hypothetical protein [Burkholderia vietnamiensis]MCA8447561.1 hypothetical protein [Burkholderia vietnamiensis]
MHHFFHGAILARVNVLLIHVVFANLINMVFNVGMDTNDTSPHLDWQLIERLGGASKVARLLGYSEGGAQRVHNWKHRGIPSEVKLQRPDLFLTELIERAKSSDGCVPAEPTQVPV